MKAFVTMYTADIILSYKTNCCYKCIVTNCPSHYPIKKCIVCSFVCSSIHPSIHPFSYLPNHPFIHLAIYPTIHLTIHSFIQDTVKTKSSDMLLYKVKMFIFILFIFFQLRETVRLCKRKTKK